MAVPGPAPRAAIAAGFGSGSARQRLSPLLEAVWRRRKVSCTQNMRSWECAVPDAGSAAPV